MLKENGPNKEEHPHTHRTHHMKQTVEGLHCTHCSSGTLHSTENCLHPYIPAQTGGDGREGNIWVRFLSLMVQWARFDAVVRLLAQWSLMQTWSQGMNTHTHTSNFPFNAGGDPQLTGGPCLEPEPTNPEAEGKDYGGKWQEGEGRSNRKNITT